MPSTPRTRKREQTLTWTILLVGCTTYWFLIQGMFMPTGTTSFGTYIYNYYFLSLLDGRLDLPARIISLEGQYDSAGRGYAYYGLTPLLSRAVLAPLLDLKSVSLAPLTIWLFAAGGTAIYHLTFARLIDRYSAEGRDRTVAIAVIGIMVWVASPGPVLVSSASLYHEPISAAYFASACFVAIAVRVLLLGMRPISAAIPLALVVSLCIHARPHVAVGLCIGFIGVLILHFRSEGLREFARVFTSIVLVALAGLSFLAMSELQFGSALHFLTSRPDSPTLYGFKFWGAEPLTSPRFVAFDEHGRINFQRIPATSLLYFFDVGHMHISDLIMNAFRSASSHLGYIRVESPRVGALYMWAPWFGLVALGLAYTKFGPSKIAFLIIPCAISALLALSYGTVTLRYKVEVWPLVISAAAMLLPNILLARVSNLLSVTQIRYTIIYPLLVAIPVMIGVVTIYPYELREVGLRSTWSHQTCVILATRKGFNSADVERICRL